MEYQHSGYSIIAYIKMSFLDIFFKKEKREEVYPQKVLPSEQLGMQNCSVRCGYCGFEIYQYEKKTKIAGKSFHRRCVKKMRKQAKEVVMG